MNYALHCIAGMTMTMIKQSIEIHAVQSMQVRYTCEDDKIMKGSNIRHQTQKNSKNQSCMHACMHATCNMQCRKQTIAGTCPLLLVSYQYTYCTVLYCTVPGQNVICYSIVVVVSICPLLADCSMQCKRASFEYYYIIVRII